MNYKWIAFCFIPFVLWGNAQKLFVLDKDLSPGISSNDARVILQELGDLKKKYLPVESISSEFLKGMIRLLELSLFWDPLNYTTSIMQHEIFGHGYRIRSLPSKYIQVKGYDFHITWPNTIGESSAATSFIISPEITSGPLISVSIAGMEASSIMAKRLKMAWLQQQKINPLQANLYIFSFHDVTAYVMGTLDKNDKMENDISSYVYLLNKQYHSSLTVHDLKKQITANLLDPMTFFCVYSWYRYILTGKDTKIPMVPLGSVYYLPTFRCALAPYGTEYYFESFLRFPKLVYAYLRYGSLQAREAYGLGVEIPQIWSKNRFTFGMRFDVFNQPKIFFHHGYFPYEDIYKPCNLQKKIWGGLLSVMATYSIENRLSFYAETGYKTKGYIPGESLQNQVIFRGGFGAEW